MFFWITVIVGLTLCILGIGYIVYLYTPYKICAYCGDRFYFEEGYQYKDHWLSDRCVSILGLESGKAYKQLLIDKGAKSVEIEWATRTYNPGRRKWELERIRQMVGSRK